MQDSFLIGEHPDMTQPPLDAMDRKILDVAAGRGRASNVELAAEVHLSAPQCFRRIRALEERGVIRGYAARSIPRRSASA